MRVAVDDRHLADGAHTPMAGLPNLAAEGILISPRRVRRQRAPRSREVSDRLDVAPLVAASEPIAVVRPIVRALVDVRETEAPAMQPADEVIATESAITTEPASDASAPTPKKATTKKPTKKATAKKAAAPKAETKVVKQKDDETAMTGEAIVALAQEAGRSKEATALASLAAKVAKGSPTHAQLVSLRDAVNALSAMLREQGEKQQVALAKQLSKANRAVRRLERAAR